MILYGRNIIINTPPAPAERLYTTHLMNALTSHGDDLQGWINYMIDTEGHNHFWLFGDYYYGNPTASNVLDAVAANGNAKVMMGNQFSNVPVDNTGDMIEDTINHAAIYKYNGLPVYHGYDTQVMLTTVKTELASRGISRSDFYYWVYTRYPRDFTRTLYEDCTISTTTYKVVKGNNIQVGLYVHIPGGTNRLITAFSTANGSYDTITVATSIGVSASAGSHMEMWYEEFSTITALNEAEHIFDIRTDVDGLVNFAADKPSGLPTILAENTFISQAAANKGKVAIAGINHMYSSAQQSLYGFDGLLSQIKSILALPLNEWPLGICDTTANDSVERSTMSRHQNPSVNGLAYVPNVSAGYTLGPTVSYPLLDNSGINKFIKPWINKFKASDITPVVITTDKIFAWYTLHPMTATYVTTIPSYLNTNWPSTINGVSKASYWSTTFYAVGDEKTNNIKSSMPASYTNIKMAAHLVTSGYLRIAINGNTYTSALKSAGDAYYEVTHELGTPVFSIIDADGTTVRKTGTGPQAITSSCWPGGWNPLIVEI